MTDGADVRNALIEAAYASAAEGAWKPFLTEYRNAFPFSLVALGVFDAQVQEVNVAEWVGYSDEAIADYVTYFSRINPWVGVGQGPGLGVVRARSVVPLDTVLKSEFYVDWMRWQDDAADGFGLKLAAEPGRSIMIANNYNLRHEAAAEGMIATANAIFPHLRRAFDLQRRLAGVRLRAEAFDAALDRLGVAAFVVDGACRILATNGRAEVMLRRGAFAGAGRFRVLRLDAADRADSLSAEVRKASLLAAAAPARIRLAIDDGGPVFAEVAPLVVDGGDPDARPVLVTILHAATGEVDPQALIEAFGLTMAEARLAAALGRGDTLKDHAARVGVTYETARSRLKAVFDKTGVNRQADLTRLVSRFAPR